MTSIVEQLKNEQKFEVLEFLKKEGIIGSRLWCLYSNICNKKIEEIIKIVEALKAKKLTLLKINAAITHYDPKLVSLITEEFNQINHIKGFYDWLRMLRYDASD